jgi:rhodanese-related sulfurtransferase
MPITKGHKQLLEEARRKIHSMPAAAAVAKLGDPDTVFVDIRDPRELEHEGVIPGAVHAPRGMMEFWVDPESPYYRPVFGDESKTYVLFCALGWRSTLTAATLTDMGMANVCDIEGGMAAWKLAGGPVAPKPQKKANPQ